MGNVEGSANNRILPRLLTEKEDKLIEFCRKMGYGECTLFVQDGEPVRVEQPIKSVKF